MIYQRVTISVENAPEAHRGKCLQSGANEKSESSIFNLAASAEHRNGMKHRGNAPSALSLARRRHMRRQSQTKGGEGAGGNVYMRQYQNPQPYIIIIKERE